MRFNSTKTKTSFRKVIKQKQALFNRFKKRCKTCKNHSERQFLKVEAGRLCKELKMCAKQWKACGFGSCNWITKSCKMTGFNTPTKTNSRKRPANRNSRKSSTRKYAKRTTSRARRSYGFGSRANRTRSTYVAW